MKRENLREKSVEKLNSLLQGLLREQYNMRLQKTKNASKKQTRREIARIKTLLKEKLDK